MIACESTGMSFGAGVKPMRGRGHADGGDGAGEMDARLAALARLRERQRQLRNSRIEELVEQAVRSGQTADRSYWSLVYDLELAPVTTNRAQLAELGVDAPDPASLQDEALAEALWRIIHGLSNLHTYLLHTDHLSDRQLYERLVATILDEPVREICEGSGGREFIDLTGGTESPPSPMPPLVDRDRHLPRPEDP